ADALAQGVVGISTHGLPVELGRRQPIAAVVAEAIAVAAHDAGEGVAIGVAAAGGVADARELVGAGGIGVGSAPGYLVGRRLAQAVAGLVIRVVFQRRAAGLGDPSQPVQRIVAVGFRRGVGTRRVTQRLDIAHHVAGEVQRQCRTGEVSGSVVGIVAARDGLAVTQGVVDNRAERQPIDIADHGRRRATAAGRDLYATEQAIAVVAVVDLGAIGREHAAQAVGERVAVDRDIRMTGRHLLLLADVAMPTVTVDGGYATFHDPGQSPDGPGTRAPRHRIGLVVVIADIERAVGIAGAGQAIVGIVGRTADDTLGVGMGEA